MCSTTSSFAWGFRDLFATTLWKDLTYFSRRGRAPLPLFSRKVRPKVNARLTLRLHANGVLVGRLLNVESKHQPIQILQPDEIPTLHHRLDRPRNVDCRCPDWRSNVPERRIICDNLLVIVEQRHLPELGPKAIIWELFDEGGEGVVGRVALKARIEGGLDEKDFQEGEIRVFGRSGDGVGG